MLDSIFFFTILITLYHIQTLIVGRCKDFYLIRLASKQKKEGKERERVPSENFLFKNFSLSCFLSYGKKERKGKEKQCDIGYPHNKKKEKKARPKKRKKIVL